MLCVPSYTISKVDVIRKESRTLVMPSVQNSSRSSNSLSAWELTDAQFSAHRGINGVTWAQRLVGSSGYAMDMDIQMEAATATQLASDTPATRLFEFDFLQSLIAKHHGQITAIIAKTSLMAPAFLNTTGVYILREDRLIMRTWAAQWMAGLTAGCIILTTIILLLIPTQGVLPRNPANSLLSLAALLYHSRDLIARVRFLGAADRKNLVRLLQPYTYATDSTGAQKHFVIREHAYPNSDQGQHHISPQMQSKKSHPGLLHPSSRFALGFILIALIIALELMLRKSISEDGLGEVGDRDDTFIHYTWTTLPALVFGSLALAFAAADFQIRSITPYTTLQSTTSTQVFIHSELLDMSFPRLIYREIKLRHMGALAGSTALLLSSAFTIFSASLFQPLSLSTTNLINLHSTSSFDRDMRSENLRVGFIPAIFTSSLLLVSNLSYPKFTYGDLAFPVLEPTMLPAGSLNASSIVTVVPALRGKLDCRAFPMSKIKIEPAHGPMYSSPTSDEGYENPLLVTIEEEGCNKDLSLLPPGPPDTGYDYFGQAQQWGGGLSIPIVSGCSQLAYYWGKYNPTPEPKPIQYAAGMGCNVTFELVDVDTTFLNTNLDIDPDNPPRPRQGTAIPSQIDSKIGLADLHLYDGLAQRATTQFLDPFFSLLTSSPFAIPTDYLGNASMNEAVMEAIKTQHGIIQAQIFHAGLKLANATNSSNNNIAAAIANGRNFSLYLLSAVISIFDFSRRSRPSQPRST